MNNTAFAYSAARVRALETKLLNMPDMERMLGAKDAREAYKVLNDLEYANHIGDIDNVKNFQEVITAGLHDSKEILEAVCPESKVLDVLFLRYDFHNIKTILKGMLSGKTEEEIRAQLLPLGRVSADHMMNFFYTKEASDLPLPEEYVFSIKAWVERAQKAAKENDNDPRILDLVLDQALMHLLADIANLTKHPFVDAFVKQSIDLHNIKIFLRVKLLKQTAFFKEKNRMDLLFARGGGVPTTRFTGGMETDIDSLANVFRGTDYFEVVQRGLEAFSKFKSFVYLEKYADEHLMLLAKKAKYTPFGPEALMAYFYAKQNNAQIIRMIMVGKLNAIPEEMLRERLHELYV